ncbi:MAG: hypothetical protein Q8O03_03635 [Nanoarchaeota archaeon]|nr:hypothetical protein [Nanoarchaeota archaeon]
MKIKGKEIREYFKPENIGMDAYYTTHDIVEFLEKDTKECLEDLVLTLQDRAYRMAQLSKDFNVSETMREKYNHQAWSYLDAVGDINRIFGTNYSTSIDKVKIHFENKTPAKD